MARRDDIRHPTRDPSLVLLDERPEPPAERVFKHGRGEITLNHCIVVGIVNRTPDSFYDGGRMDLDASMDHALELIDEGAEILDVGAVKAGPGEPVTEDEERGRLLPLVERLARRTGIPLSIETASPDVARSALSAGAAIVNDVSGLRDETLAGVCADAGAALVLMHHGGQIRGRPRHPRYDDVVAAVTHEWNRLAKVALAAGVRSESLIADPGLDFGKTTYHSLQIMRRIDELMTSEYLVLISPSRKDIVGETLDLDPAERLEGTIALIALSAAAGASAVRVHDVRAAVRAVHMAEAVVGRRAPEAAVRGLWD